MNPVATSLVSCSKAEVVECPVRNPCWLEAGCKCVLTVVSMRAFITFTAGKSSEIGRFEVPREDSLPGLGIGMTIDDFHVAGIRHDVTEAARMSNESALTRMTDSTPKKPWSDLTLVLDG